MEKLKILFLSPNGQPNGPRARIHNFAKRLVCMDHDVSILTKSHFHGTNYNYLCKKDVYRIEKINGVQTYWINTTIYRRNGLKRFISEIEFVLKCIFLSFNKIDRPDIIIADSVTPINSLGGYLLAKLLKAKFIHQIRDIWPIALYHDGSLSKLNPLYLFFSAIEKFIYKKCDWICTALPHVHEHVKQSGGNSERITYIRNGADLSVYSKFSSYSSTNRAFKFVYMGTISFAHDVITIVRAAKLIDDLNDVVTFHIYGNGVKKEECILESKKLGLKNVIFHDMIPKKDVPKILSDSDLLLAPVLNSKAYTFGINLNKLYDYFASGRPVLFSGNTPNDDVKEASCGYSIDPEDPIKMADCFRNFVSLSPAEKAVMGKNAKRYADEFYNVDNLVQYFEKMCFELIYFKP